MTKDLLVPDIITFAQRQYEQLSLPKSKTDAVLERVRSFSHGSFLWAELYLHNLGQSLQVTEFQARMRAFPPSLGDCYRQLLLSAAHRLSQNELYVRGALLLTIFQAQRPLRTTEIADAFSLLPEKAEIIISNLCKPLVNVYDGLLRLSHPSVREFFELCRTTNDSSLGISFSDSHALLAEKCLSCLLDERYANLDRIGSYLVANHDGAKHVSSDARPLKDGFYDYAHKFWDYHLVRSTTPSESLLQQVNRFILSLQFAYWSEFSRRDCGQLVRVVMAFRSLTSWHKGLSKKYQVLIKLDEYFERPYTLLTVAFDSQKGGTSLPCLVRLTMGDYYFIMFIPKKATPMRERALEELQKLLGPQHHLTLRAKSDVAYVRLYDGNMRASYKIYNEVVKTQRAVLGEHSAHLLETLIYKGQSEFYMASFSAATNTWRKVSTECLGLLGPNSWQYLSAQLWLARGLAYMDQLDSGLQILQLVAQRRRELFGPDDSFCNAVQLNVGEIQLLLGQHEEAIATLQDVLEWRRETFLLSNMVRLDAEITLAIAYRAAGMSQDALAIIKEVEDEVENLHSEFERYCQIVHLKGLLLAEAGSLDKAIHLLEDIVIQAEEGQNNRALLWIRLDLATLLRRRGRGCDRAAASIKFDKIVKETSGDHELSILDEPDSPELLAAAEEALRLVRSRQHIKARHALDSAHLDWRRPKDLWLWVGGSFYRDLLQIAEPAVTGAD
ncbi:hypothetical protein ONZ43_g1346 [Nemania bipapillata]|uniref:Uncharacterized protein n=1 Tax=Nemania bipapillata TaxID=110536 RepID=A0ACC2J554_9PEZI|nr:hypothetical protein ONZ43_g1346 [Nemania bipapillata]